MSVTITRQELCKQVPKSLLFNENSVLTKGHNLTLYHTIPTFDDLGKNTFENIEGKGENAGNQHFPLSHNIFKPI